MLIGKNLHKSFFNNTLRTPILKGVDIHLKEGEFISIMGKSGSGKSTLLNLLSTLDSCDEGEIRLENERIDHLADDDSAKLRREHFGFVFQLPRMVKNLSILDNILLPSLQYSNQKEDTVQRAKNLMKEIGIESIADKKISEVSGGQLQRAGICRALINNPKIIFADEPTGALDSKSGQDVLSLFSTLHQKGKTILLVTHDLQVAAQSQRVLFMKDGLLRDEVVLSENHTDNQKILQPYIHAL